MKGRNKKGQFTQGNTLSKKYTEKDAIQLGEELINWMRESETNIQFQEFFVVIKGMNPKTYNYLSTKYESFSNMLELAKKMQEIRIVKGGLLNEYNSTFCKFLLSANHGMSEKVVNEVQTIEQPIIKLEIIDDNRKAS